MKRVLRIAAVSAVPALLAACSSSFTRFDYPVMGMNGGPVEEKAKYYDEREAPVRRDYSANRYQTKRYDAPDYKVNSDYGRDQYSSNKRSTSDKYSNRYVDNRDVYNTASTHKQRGGYDRYADGGLYSDGRDNFGRSDLPSLQQQSRVQRTSSGHHIVSEGDTLYNISRRYDVSVSRIKEANGLNGNDIKQGQRLAIPGLTKSAAMPKKPLKRRRGSRYIVARGDTAYSIARRHGISTRELADANNLDDLTRLSEGQELRIPGGKTAAKKAKPVRVASIDKKIGYSKTNRKVAQPKRKSVNDKKIKAVSSGKFLWPARGRILSSFGRQKSGTINDGVNIAIPSGSKIKSAGDGVVAYAGSELKGYGKLILVRHSNNWVTAYAHNSKLLVKRGDKVSRGQVIAKSGKSGSVMQPQLHFELRKGSKPVNPMRHLAVK